MNDAETFQSAIEVFDTTPSTSSVGSIMTSGGITIYCTSNSVSVTQGGGITCLGGMSIVKDTISTGTYKILSSVNSVSPSSGSLYTLGGIGTALDLNVGGGLRISSTEPTSITSSGGITLSKGIALAGLVNLNGVSTSAGRNDLFLTTDSTSNTRMILQSGFPRLAIQNVGTTGSTSTESFIIASSTSGTTLSTSRSGTGSIRPITIGVAPQLYLETNGNVGINSTSANVYTLFINGTVLVNDVFHADTQDTYISDTKSAGTNGGTFTAGAWTTRTLNTISTTNNGVSALSSDTFTVRPGIYKVCARAPASGVFGHKARLFDVTANTVGILGTTTCSYRELLNGNNASMNDSWITGKITVNANNQYRIEHFCEQTLNSTGLGRALGTSSEVYTSIHIQRLKTLE